MNERYSRQILFAEIGAANLAGGIRRVREANIRRDFHIHFLRYK
jgi:hypothetical protein